MAGGDKCEIA